ncbi:MAG TPA: hypothetical protein VKG43_06685, partial [Acidimicrobiales bacterium]|nr:hypothetical protein [Acidimicrobiales bacterium]
MDERSTDTPSAVGRSHRGRRAVLALALSAGAVPLAVAIPASGAPSHPTAASTPKIVAFGYHVKALAGPGTGQSKPDDVTQLGKDIFVGWQNGVGPN